MAQRVSEVLAERAGRFFVGRDAELALLEQLLSGGIAVVQIHGIAGIGKSALLGAFLERARARDAAVIHLDCRVIEPTERGFLEAMGKAAGYEVESVEALPERLGVSTRKTIVALDNYEVFRLMDTWFRQVFVPGLDHRTGIVLAGREAPVAAWFTGGWGDLFRSLQLGPLDERDAQLLLLRHGVQEHQAHRLNSIARGHPLALTLAAAAAADRPDLAVEEAATGRVVGELTRIYLEDVEDPVTRRALEAASVVRRATRSLLSAMLAEADPDETLERLAALPFVERRADGLVIHDAVRAAIASALRGADPARYREYRRDAWRQLRHEVRDAGEGELWRYTADMLFIIENPIVREAFFPTAMQQLVVEAARPEDEAAIRRITRRHEGPEEADMLEAWWRAAPATFSVVRDREGAVEGFFILLDNATIRPPAVPDDPVLRQWVEHLHAERVPPGDRVLGLRRWLDTDHGEAPCASQAACWLDVKRTYMALRPDLRRIYVTVQAVPTYWPTVERLGFRSVADRAVELDRTPYSSVCLDFGPASVDGWLAGLVATELGLEPRINLDDKAHEVTIDGSPIALTPLELGVLRQLRDARGRTLTRPDLLNSVWGTDYTEGSNVVDAVVHTLRGKLGTYGIAVETVRGAGYRLRKGWTELT